MIARLTYLRQPDGNVLPKAAQDAFGFFCHKGTLLPDAQFDVYQDL